MAVQLRVRLEKTENNSCSCEDKILSSIQDNYCSRKLRDELIAYCAQVDNKTIEDASIMVDYQLDKMRCANEHKLCLELNNLLHRFTGKDKKLDDKERKDLIDMVCKPRVGIAKGLLLEVAEKSIIDYCRSNHVKVKVGILSWKVP